MLKEPKAGEWWLDDNDKIIYIAFDERQMNTGSEICFFCYYKCEIEEDVAHTWRKLEELAEHLPDCDGFNWVKPVPVVVESPDDFVVQDRVPARIGIDKGWWSAANVTPAPSAHWFDVNSNHTGMMHRHQCKDRTALNLCCRRKDLPKPAEPTNQDYVTQDVAPIRVGVDEFRYLKMNFRMSDTYDNFRGHEHHGWIHPDTGEALELRCLRSQLPVPEPKKTRVELRLWVNKFTGEIVHDSSMNTMDDWHEVLFDTTGQPYYLKD